MSTALAHRADPVTSHIAAASISAKQQIKNALIALLEEEPRAAFELTEAYFNLREANGWPACKPDGIAKRLSELHKVDHLVVETDRTVMSPYNRPAVVWQVV